ncbi:MAG: type II toxin-antitoxin system HicB family antitoxin [Thermomicrobiales bacterium]
MQSFLVMLTPDQLDGGDTVTVPGLPGLVTHGDSVEEALSNAKEAIELYLPGGTPESLAANGVRSDLLLATVDVRLTAWHHRARMPF